MNNVYGTNNNNLYESNILLFTTVCGNEKN